MTTETVAEKLQRARADREKTVAVQYPIDLPIANYPHLVLIQKSYERNIQQFNGENPEDAQKIKRVYILPFPHGITNSHGATWTAEDLGAAGSLLKSNGVLDKNNLEALESLAVSGAKNVAEAAITRFGANGSSIVSGVGSVVSVAGGVALNPFTTFLFSGTNFRNIGFGFTLFARSDAEQRVIDTIRNGLRLALYPLDNTQALIDYPDLFEIRVGGVVDAEQRYFKFERAALQDVQITINPDSPHFHDDNSPISYSLSISFQEMDLLDQKRIGAGAAY